MHGLPLELSPEEVTLALERGWAELAPALGTEAAAAAGAAGIAGRKRAREAEAWQQDEEEDEELGDGEAMDADVSRPQEEPAEPSWRAALAGGTSFDIPITPAEAAASNAGRGAGEATATAAAAQQAAGGEATGQGPAAAAGSGHEAPPWAFPATQEERHRYWVFRDLHAKG